MWVLCHFHDGILIVFVKVCISFAFTEQAFLLKFFLIGHSLYILNYFYYQQNMDLVCSTIIALVSGDDPLVV